jgi:N-glycosylase/DNA lyase
MTGNGSRIRARSIVISEDPCGASSVGPSLNCDGQLVRLEVGESVLTFHWGHEHSLGSAAYWIQQATAEVIDSHELGRNLEEEVAACLLGGFGMPAKVGLAAFEAVRSRGLIRTDPPPHPDEVEEVLRLPLPLPSEKSVRYRFPLQRAQRLSACLSQMGHGRPPSEPLELRTWLLSLPGIGPKTASWIVRNHLGSSDVAIVDIHVMRAGLAAGFFSPKWSLPRDYALYEGAFIEVARLGAVSAGDLDACIWGQLQRLGRDAELILGPTV